VPSFNTKTVVNMDYMFDKCPNIKEIDPWHFSLYDFNKCNSPFLKEKYPELYI
jgi:hypothetical protein